MATPRDRLALLYNRIVFHHLTLCLLYWNLRRANVIAGPRQVCR